jgi:hypothetical protein
MLYFYSSYELINLQKIKRNTILKPLYLKIQLAILKIPTKSRVDTEVIDATLSNSKEYGLHWKSQILKSEAQSKGHTCTIVSMKHTYISRY